MSAPNVKAIPPKCASINEAADLVGVAPLTITRLIKASKLRASHVGRRVVIKLADRDRYLADNEVRA
jgi:excisionase family DNA binding protein